VGKPAGAAAVAVFVLSRVVSANALTPELLLEEFPVALFGSGFPLFAFAGTAGECVFGLVALVSGPVMVRVAHQSTSIRVERDSAWPSGLPALRGP
jgi:hypothetical protein